MNRLLPLVLLLGLSLAFALGLLVGRREELPSIEYRRQVETARAAAAKLDARPCLESLAVRVARRLRPSVVSIHGISAGGGSSSSGSGVILDPVGHVLTNLHVIRGMRHLVVTLSSQERYVASLVGSDGPTDLAVLKIAAGRHLQPVVFGDSEALQAGEEVLAIGNALGFGWTVTKGIISSLHRSSLRMGSSDRLQRYQDFIQTDATVNPGNSGGPLVNMRGEVIGINALLVKGDNAGEAIGLAIPSADAWFVARELRAHGRVERSFLGIRGGDVQGLSRKERRQRGIPGLHGVDVSFVLPRSPAALAGLQKGDVILSVAGMEVPDLQGLRSRVARMAAGTQVSFLVLRKREKRAISVVLRHRSRSSS